MPAIKLTNIDDQEVLIRHLYTLGYKLDSDTDDLDEALSEWSEDILGPDGTVRYPYMVIWSGTNTITAYPAAWRISEFGDQYTMTNSINHFVSYARRIRPFVAIP